MELNGINLLAEKSLAPFLAGQQIDYVTANGREGFVVGPEIASGCC